MLAEHTVFAVHRDKVMRFCQRKHHLQFFLTGMAGDMQRCVAIINDLCPLLEQLVYDAADRDLIARDCRGGDNNAVARVDRDLLVFGKCHAVQRGHRLALAAGTDDNRLTARQTADL